MIKQITITNEVKRRLRLKIKYNQKEKIFHIRITDRLKEKSQ